MALYYDEGAGMMVDDGTGEGVSSGNTNLGPQIQVQQPEQTTQQETFTPPPPRTSEASNSQAGMIAEQNAGFPQGDLQNYGVDAPTQQEKPSYVQTLLDGILKPDALKTVLGTTIMGSMNGISSWLTARSKSESDMAVVNRKYDREDKQTADKIARQSNIGTRAKNPFKKFQGEPIREFAKPAGLISSTRTAP